MREKNEIITFKVNKNLADLLKTVPNRSQFIRDAILNAFENACPLCSGTGILSLEQRKHWNTFVRDHSVRTCKKCNETYIVCKNTDKKEGKCDRVS